MYFQWDFVVTNQTDILCSFWWIIFDFVIMEITDFKSERSFKYTKIHRQSYKTINKTTKIIDSSSIFMPIHKNYCHNIWKIIKRTEKMNNLSLETTLIKWKYNLIYLLSSHSQVIKRKEKKKWNSETWQAVNF